MTDASVAGVIMMTGGEQPGKYASKIVEFEPGRRLWFVLLPEFAATPYIVRALDQKGNIAAEKTLAAPINDTGVLKSGDSR
ncbi:hypothetical protein [Cohnella rhizosphaerae]|uniref:Uncharacterized protein n=1 Tax=Cohnella rhizosphaerae TaxID=1457232 RepID=A0A9X4KR56_9BACL|nr:hypothetical protein [Cohnella rhizosphaerae]MDG0809599.1 hypothetical protein [Cohnella rhizosphaerae]